MKLSIFGLMIFGAVCFGITVDPLMAMGLLFWIAGVGAYLEWRLWE